MLCDVHAFNFIACKNKSIDKYDLQCAKNVVKTIVFKDAL